MNDTVTRARDHLTRLSGAIVTLRGGMPEMPATWSLVLLEVAQRPGCTTSWLCERVGLSTSVVNRIAQELGSSKPGSLDLLDTLDDPLNAKRKLHVLSSSGVRLIEDVLLALAGVEVAYDEDTSEKLREALALPDELAYVRTDHFTPVQLGTIKLAASRREDKFLGKHTVVFPLGPIRRHNELLRDMSDWISNNNGRWIPMNTIYADDGGVGVADFDNHHDAFYFVIKWRGPHKTK